MLTEPAATATMETPGDVSVHSLYPHQICIDATSIDFPHDHARTRTFRWGEDGIAGVSDSHGLQNISFAFWNEKEYVLDGSWTRKRETDTNVAVVTFLRNAYLDCLTHRVTMEKA